MTREDIVAFFARRQAAVDRRDAEALAGFHAEHSVVESLLAGSDIGGFMGLPATERPA